MLRLLGSCLCILAVCMTEEKQLSLSDSWYLHSILNDLGVKPKLMHVLTDSKATYDTVRNPGATKKSAHVERWLMFARDNYLRGRFSMALVPTLNMMADMMTKVVDRDKFFKCRDYVMGGHCPAYSAGVVRTAIMRHVIRVVPRHLCPRVGIV